MLKIKNLYFEKGSQVSFLLVSLVIIKGIINMFFQVSPLLLYLNQTCCLQTRHSMRKKVKNCRFTVHFSIIGFFLRVLEIRTTYVSESDAYHNHLQRSYCHHIRALFVFQTLQYVNIYLVVRKTESTQNMVQQ